MSGIVTKRRGTKLFLPGETIIGTQTWKIRNVDYNIVGSKVYDDDENNRIVYGGLYTWAMISDIEALYPGWHVPESTEWTTLQNYLGGDSGGKLKEVGLSHWGTPNTGAVDTFGFCALPGGIYNYAGVYVELHNYGYFWNATQYDVTYAYSEYLSCSSSVQGRDNRLKTEFHSVRLIKG